MVGLSFPQEDDSAEKNLDIWAGDGNGDTKAKKVMKGSLMPTNVCI
jgi:nucleolar protein 53